jgi:hypothetical protein
MVELAACHHVCLYQHFCCSKHHFSSSRKPFLVVSNPHSDETLLKSPSWPKHQPPFFAHFLKTTLTALISSGTQHQSQMGTKSTPSGHVKIAIENDPFIDFIVDLPSWKMVIFHSYGTVYQRVLFNDSTILID